MPLFATDPSADIYTDHQGMTFHPQDDPATSPINQPHYEINAESDALDLDISTVLSELGSNPKMIIYTAHGNIGFSLKDPPTGETIIDEYSGFETDAWIAEVDGHDILHITDFNAPDGSVDATQAALLPVVNISSVNV